MRYDDPQRPQFTGGAIETALQVNRSPLPTITLMRPMQSETPETYKVCSGREGCTGPETGSDEGCTACDVERETVWGWLCCIHAHKGTNRFGTYYGWIRDLGEFQREYLEDPEATLLRYFKYSGPDYEQTVHSPLPKAVIADDIFAGD